MELQAAKEANHPIHLQAVYDDFAANNNVEELLANIEAEEEQHWIERPQTSLYPLLVRYNPNVSHGPDDEVLLQ